MSTYHRTNGPRGRFIYFKDNKMVSVKAIPENVLNSPMLEAGEKVHDSVIIPREKFCLFCGQPSTDERLIGREYIPLCNEHYQQKTLGEIVERLSIDNKPKRTDNEDIKEQPNEVNA